MGVNTLRTNLIVHHGITDIFRQAPKPGYILGAIQESRDLPPFCQRAEVSEDGLQFPSNFCTSNPSLCLGEDRGLPFEGLSSPLLPELAFRNRLTERLREPFNPGHQRFDCLTTRHRLLERS